VVGAAAAGAVTAGATESLGAPHWVVPRNKVAATAEDRWINARRPERRPRARRAVAVFGSSRWAAVCSGARDDRCEVFMGDRCNAIATLPRVQVTGVMSSQKRFSS
jgi:hypothetical protein